MKQKVIVLGCGPAGLLAAHIALGMNAEILILAKKRKSHIYGAQYLHEPILGWEDGDPIDVNYALVGDIDGYRRKVYGDQDVSEVSPESLLGQHKAWDLRHSYGYLWSHYESFVHDTNITPYDLKRIMEELPDAKFISTIPAPSLCHEGHTFTSQKIKAAGEAPDRGIKLPYDCPEDTVICNGNPDISWYRLSNIFGHKTVEWPENISPPVLTAAIVEKPIKHNCTCFQDVLRVGRYGAWKKGYLVNHVKKDVSNWLGQ